MSHAPIIYLLLDT